MPNAVARHIFRIFLLASTGQYLLTGGAFYVLRTTDPKKNRDRWILDASAPIMSILRPQSLGSFGLLCSLCMPPTSAPFSEHCLQVHVAMFLELKPKPGLGKGLPSLKKLLHLKHPRQFESGNCRPTFA